MDGRVLNPFERFDRQLAAAIEQGSTGSFGAEMLRTPTSGPYYDGVAREQPLIPRGKRAAWGRQCRI